MGDAMAVVGEGEEAGGRRGGGERSSGHVRFVVSLF